MIKIGVAGGSGSGKTTFAKKIVELVQDESVFILPQDSYYLENPPEHTKIDGVTNYDHPDAFDWDYFKNDLTAIFDHKKVDVPFYDYHQSSRQGSSFSIEKPKVLIVEGIYTLWNEEIRDLFDLKIFIHVESDIRFIRRLHRDLNERGRTVEQIISQYYQTVRPMYRQYLEPTKDFADFIVPEENQLSAEVVAAMIRERLKA